jgi:hypothetical protein
MGLVPKIELSTQNIILAVFGVVTVAVAIFFIQNNLYVRVPQTIILKVPFYTQAPSDNWYRNEDCEETSILMANAFLTGINEDKIPANVAQEAINSLKRWEQANFGYDADTGANATAQMAERVFGLRVKKIGDYSEADLKKELARGRPILLPINAELLHNPKYLDFTPMYHMVVIKGYRGSTFIINDPGTNSGSDNEYAFNVLKGAAADWDNVAKKIDASQKIALVVYN